MSNTSLFGLPECLHSCCCFSISFSLTLSLLIPLSLLAAVPVAGRACSKYVTKCSTETLGILIYWGVGVGGVHNGGTCAWCASESSDSMTDRQCELAASRSLWRGLWNIIKAKTSSTPLKTRHKHNHIRLRNLDRMPLSVRNASDQEHKNENRSGLHQGSLWDNEDGNVRCYALSSNYWILIRGSFIVSTDSLEFDSKSFTIRDRFLDSSITNISNSINLDEVD